MPGTDLPVVITYISRQGVRRHLVEEDHERLVQELTELCSKKGWKLYVVQAERLTKEEQLELAAKSTVRVNKYCLAHDFSPCPSPQVLLGVHGNGLTVRPRAMLRVATADRPP